MSLFKVKGWDVKAEIASDANPKKSKKNRKTPASTNSDPKDTKKQNITKKDKSKLKGLSKKRKIQDVEEEFNAEEKNLKEKDIHKKQHVERSPESAPALEKLTPLQKKMMLKLSGSRFRWINEQLYTTRSEEALKLIKDQPELFKAYHDGFRSQVESWPENPVDVFFKEFAFRGSKKRVNAPGGLPGINTETNSGKTKKQVVLADMGCGEAMLALNIENFIRSKKCKNKELQNTKIHSFDLQKANKRITVADIKNVPLEDESCSIVVFCLSLMGTNFLDFIKEAYRILAPRGELWISEIKLRFADKTKGEEFVETLKLLGFFHKKTNDENKMFTNFEFFKPPQEILNERREKLEKRKKFIELELEKEKLIEKRNKKPEGEWLLKPCIYKRR